MPKRRQYEEDAAKATAYLQNSANRLPEKRKNAKVIASQVAIERLGELKRKYDFLCCDLLVNRCRWSKKILTANSNLEKSYNPVHTGKTPNITIPENFNDKFVFNSTFRVGCNAPACVKAREFPAPKRKCTFSMQVRGETASKGKLVSVWCFGSHCEDFFPDESKLKLDASARHLMKETLSAISNPLDVQRIIQAAIPDSIPGTAITTATISQQKYNTTQSKFGPASLSFDNAKRMLDTFNTDPNSNIRCASIVAGMQMEKMTPTNFQFVLFFNQAIARAKKYLVCHVLHDSVWRLLDLPKEEQLEKHCIPVLAIGAVNNDFTIELIAASLASSSGSGTIQAFFEATRTYLCTHLSLTEWNPTIIIDDGSAEVCAMKAMNATYFICKFHLVRAWQRNMKGSQFDNDTISNILNILYQMYAAKSETQYFTLQQKLQADFPDWYNNYFTKTWEKDKFYLRWSCIVRPNCDTAYNTTNLLERLFHTVRDFNGGKIHKRADMLIAFLMKFASNQDYNKQLVSSKSKTAHEAMTRLKLSENLKIDKSPGQTIYFVNSSTTTNTSVPLRYRIDLSLFSCTCPDYFLHVRACKHIYAASQAFLKERNKIVPFEPFEILRACHALIHYPSDIETRWSLIYPSTNAVISRKLEVAAKRQVEFEELGTCVVLGIGVSRDALFVFAHFDNYELKDAEWKEYTAQWRASVYSFIQQFTRFANKIPLPNAAHDMELNENAWSIRQMQDLYFVNDSELMPNVVRPILQLVERFKE